MRFEEFQQSGKHRALGQVQAIMWFRNLPFPIYTSAVAVYTCWLTLRAQLQKDAVIVGAVGIE